MKRVRSTLDGQIGYLVEEGGKQQVRLDRGTGVGAENRLVPYHAESWVDDAAPKLSPMGIARVCYEADRALRLARGEYSIQEWISLHSKSPASAVTWGERLPNGADAGRVALHKAILKALADQ